MAIYHCSLRVFSRSKGHSAVAAAAYRSGSVLYDERAETTHRYDKRSGVAETFIVLPEHAPFDPADRAAVWNAAEASETRKNSCVARELVLALPHELSGADRHSLTRDMASWLKERYRVAVDAAIHIPVKGDDARNHHAHLLFTTREVTNTGMGKKTRILDDKVTGKEETELIRQVWETLANDALKSAGFTDVKIDRRTLQEQGIERIPQTHIGPQAQKAVKSASDDEDEQEGKGSAKGSAGGAAQGPKKNKDKDEQGDSEQGEQGGSGDPVALKLKSKVKTDNQGRIIDYRVIDRRQTRQNFVAEIKALNEKRAAFGDAPLKDQIEGLDRLMEKLDVRLERLQTIEHKTALPARIVELFDKAMQKAVQQLGLRKDERLQTSLSRTEEKARHERQHARYGRTYRKGLHEQIREMKASIERLEYKHKEYERYKGFVDTLEQAMLKRVPAVTPDITKDPAKPVPKTSNAESTLKLQLKASVMRENLPLADTPQVQVKRPEGVARATSPEHVSTDINTPPSKEPLKLSEITRERFAPELKAKPVQKQFNSVAEELEAERARAEDYKQKNTVVFAALKQEIENRTVALQVKDEKPSPSYRQPMKVEIKALKEAMQERAQNPIRTQEQITAARQDQKTETKTQFNQAERPAPKIVTVEELTTRMQAEAAKLRTKVPEQYRAESYEERQAPPSSVKTSFSEAQTENPKNTTVQPVPSPAIKMSARFNSASAQDISEHPVPYETPEAPHDDIDLDIE
ncbi:MAG TPA: MobQ family relaxase [Alphaproteobacteria bacterium]|nr:MobA/MobL family protein [Alphaproteobacteria bacterium]HOO82160.1 MobQ family relaxase [Alphaproteobacteria bacterium]